MSYTSLRDNRKNTLVPRTAFEVDIGTLNVPLHTVYSSNVEAQGLVRCQVLEINGYIFNTDHLFIPDVTADVRSFKDVEASNLRVLDEIEAGVFLGDGNKLKLDRLENSLLPGSTEIDIGSHDRRFRHLYLFGDADVRDINARDVTANRFIGDGNLLTNLPIEKTDYLNFPTDFIPDITVKHDIGSLSRRFRDLYNQNTLSQGYIQSRQIRITNETLPTGITDFIREANEYVRNLEYDVNEEVMNKMGETIDLQLNTELIGISYTVEAIMKHGVVQRTLYPEKTLTGFIGSPDYIFRELHVLHPFFYGPLNIPNVESDNVAGVNVTASNFIGDGQYIDNITHFGRITSNIIPLFDKITDIGAEDFMFRELFADRVTTNDINVRGMRTLRVEVSGILAIDTQKLYNDFDNLSFQSETIQPFAEYVDIERGEFSVKESGIYTLSMYGVASNRNQNVDNNMHWYIYHYNRALQRGSSSLVIGQITQTMVLGKLDRIRLQMDPLQNIPLRFTQGVLVVTLDMPLPALDNYFDL